MRKLIACFVGTVQQFRMLLEMERIRREAEAMKQRRQQKWDRYFRAGGGMR